MKELDSAIYDKYIKPTEKKRELSIGVEIEMPIVDLSGEPVEIETVLEVSENFRKHFGFTVQGRDDDGNTNSISDNTNGDNLSFDCCYSNLELSMGIGSDLCEIHERFKKLYTFLQGEFAKHGYTLTGMGINPNYAVNYNKPVPNERYRMLYHYLHSYSKYQFELDRRFHEFPEFGTFTSASQVQLDVDKDLLIDTINTFGLLEPYKSLLFANSYLPEYPDYLCVRNMLWERSMQGFNPHNVGMFSQKLGSIEELLEYIKSQSIYCTMRDGRYIDFRPVSVGEFFSCDKVRGEEFDGEKYKTVEFTPEKNDLQYLRTFKFEDLTFRGTIEYRSSCCQPIKDVMSVSALHTGLVGKLSELKALLEADKVIYGHGYSPLELQDMLSKTKLPDFIDTKSLKEQLIRILDLAKAGLKARGKNEEHYLDVLFERAHSLTNPAKQMLDGIKSGKTLKDYITEYSLV